MRQTLSALSAGVASTVLMTPAAFAASAEAEPWYLNTTNWAFLTLVIFLLVVWRVGAFKALGGALDSRATEIQRELDHAQKLREEASTLLKEAERKQQEASDQADAIVRQAEADAKALLEQSEKDLAAMVARREAQVEARIARAEDEALKAVRSVAADAATKAAAEVVRSEADKSKGASTFGAALGQVKSAL